MIHQPCTCHPDEAPKPCHRKYAIRDCKFAAQYPQHARVKELGNDNQIIGNFLEWIGENGYTICTYFTDKYFDGKEYDSEGERKEYIPEGFYVPLMVRSDEPRRIEEWIGKYFGIDVKELSREKDRMYAELTVEHCPRCGSGVIEHICLKES